MHLINVYVCSASLQCSNLNCFTYQIRRWLIYLTNDFDTGSALVFIFLSSNIYSLQRIGTEKDVSSTYTIQLIRTFTPVSSGTVKRENMRQFRRPYRLCPQRITYTTLHETKYLINARNHVYLHALWYLMGQCLCWRKTSP